MRSNGAPLCASQNGDGKRSSICWWMQQGVGENAAVLVVFISRKLLTNDEPSVTPMTLSSVGEPALRFQQGLVVHRWKA